MYSVARPQGSPFMVIGVMTTKMQDSSYSGRDQDKAFIPDTTFKGLFSERYVSNFIFQAQQPSLVAAVALSMSRPSFFSTSRR